MCNVPILQQIQWKKYVKNAPKMLALFHFWQLDTAKNMNQVFSVKQ